jgi:hypothetical protein
MGIESLVYRFEPLVSETDALIAYLRSRGASNGDGDGTYVLATADHWIDVRLDPHAVVTRVSMRVAVTNPPAVVPALAELMAGLLSRWGGRITEAGGRRSLPVPEAERLAVLTNTYRAARERFTRTSGEVTFPVSADEVFQRLRERPDDQTG